MEAPLERFPLLQVTPNEAREGHDIDDGGKAFIWQELGGRVSVEALLKRGFRLAGEGMCLMRMNKTWLRRSSGSGSFAQCRYGPPQYGR